MGMTDITIQQNTGKLILANDINILEYVIEIILIKFIIFRLYKK